MNQHLLFGQYFKRMRMATGLTLRKFCLSHGIDAAYISKLERGIAVPPKSQKKLESLASFLGLREGSPEWIEFFDLAAATSGRIPADVMADAQLVEKLPLFFRTIRGQKVLDEKLDKLAELIREA